jgi:hypothetical protein
VPGVGFVCRSVLPLGGMQQAAIRMGSEHGRAAVVLGGEAFVVVGDIDERDLARALAQIVDIVPPWIAG